MNTLGYVAITLNIAFFAILCVANLAQAKGGGGNLVPAIPVSMTPSTLHTSWSGAVTIVGSDLNGGSYYQQQGNSNKFIEASFSGEGITVNSVTVNTTTTLTINLTVGSDAPLGSQHLTITNPNGQSATSATPLVLISDIPAIEEAVISPEEPSVIDDLAVEVLSVLNEDGLPVQYLYQWYENDEQLDETSATLSAQATTVGSSYHCVITPLKGALMGEPYATAAVTIQDDGDNNGIHDVWELSHFGSNGVDPNADPDGDGLSNLEEYLFGLDPNDPQSNRAVVSPLNPRTGEFEYSRPVNKIAGINYRVWTSTDLVNWTERVGASKSLSHANANSEVIKVGLNPALINANPTLFVRVTAD